MLVPQPPSRYIHNRMHAYISIGNPLGYPVIRMTQRLHIHPELRSSVGHTYFFQAKTAFALYRTYITYLRTERKHAAISGRNHIVVNKYCRVLVRDIPRLNKQMRAWLWCNAAHVTTFSCAPVAWWLLACCVYSLTPTTLIFAQLWQHNGAQDAERRYHDLPQVSSASWHRQGCF